MLPFKPPLRRPPASLLARRLFCSSPARPVFAPPPPESLGRPRTARPYAQSRSRRWLRRLLLLSAAAASVYTVDRLVYASALSRTARTLAVAAVVAADYKLNFRPAPLLARSLDAVHERNARRLADLLRANGGLYIKIGQAVAMQTVVMPPEFQRMFVAMFDDAPQDAWPDIERVLRQDFGGRSPEDVFGVSFSGDRSKGVMERIARASASIAQVHWARLPDGREVAIKIQKPEIAKQIQWDLWAFKIVTSLYSRAFDIPFSSLVSFVSERLALETDFLTEADNSERTRALVASEPRLRGRIHIPTVYRDLSSRRVLTTEWIEGVSLWDKDTLTRPWRGGRGRASPGCHDAPLDPESGPIPTAPGNRKYPLLKPNRDYWRGRSGRGGLGLGPANIMSALTDLSATQLFVFGHLHCDPHPGNVLVRRTSRGHAELVLLDHGLYVDLKPEFRRQYARFWCAMLTFDDRALAQVAREWGIADAEMMASSTLMRPYHSRRSRDSSSFAGEREQMENLSPAERAELYYQRQQRLRQALRQFLGAGSESKDDEQQHDEQHPPAPALPREFIFVARHLRLIQANNQRFGVPVNRVRTLGLWAARSLPADSSLPLHRRIRAFGSYLLFRVVLVLWDTWGFVMWVRRLLRLGGGQTFEDQIEQQVRMAVKDGGVELSVDAFRG